jgi:hypothetical protein
MAGGPYDRLQGARSRPGQSPALLLVRRRPEFRADADGGSIQTGRASLCLTCEVTRKSRDAGGPYDLSTVAEDVFAVADEPGLAEVRADRTLDGRQNRTARCLPRPGAGHPLRRVSSLSGGYGAVRCRRLGLLSLVRGQRRGTAGDDRPPSTASQLGGRGRCSSAEGPLADIPTGSRCSAHHVVDHPRASNRLCGGARHAWAAGSAARPAAIRASQIKGVTQLVAVVARLVLSRPHRHLKRIGFPNRITGGSSRSSRGT